MSFLRVAFSLGKSSPSSSSTQFLGAPRLVAALHSSAVCQESAKKRKVRILRLANVKKQENHKAQEQARKPHVVLGTYPDDPDKWARCDLAKLLVMEAELDAPRPSSSSAPASSEVDGSSPSVPQHLSFGIDGLDGTEPKDEQVRFFFEHLPETSALAEADPGLSRRLEQARGNSSTLSPKDQHMLVEMQMREAQKADQLARIVDLRNANARGIAFENRRRIIAAFSSSGKATNSGYPEVQVALLTYKIRNIWGHLMGSKKDVAGRRAIRILLHQRAKMLKYIKRNSVERYGLILERIGLEAAAVEGELVV